MMIELTALLSGNAEKSSKCISAVGHTESLECLIEDTEIRNGAKSNLFRELFFYQVMVCHYVLTSVQLSSILLQQLCTLLSVVPIYK